MALDASHDDPAIALRAWHAAVPAGDMALADRAAAILDQAGALPPEAPLIALGAAAAAHDPAAATRAIDRLAAGSLRILAPSLRAWAALETGGDPLAPLARPPANAVARRLTGETRALVLIAMGRSEEGVAALTQRLGSDAAATDLRVAAARLLIGQGRAAAATALLADDAAPLAALRTRTDGGARGTLAFGASTLFTRVASDLAIGTPNPIGYALLAGALRADPGNDRARLLLAAALAKDGAPDRALAVLDAVAPSSIYAADAVTQRIAVLTDAGRDTDALALARSTVGQPGAAALDVARLASLYSRVGRPRDAAMLYKQLIDRAGSEVAWGNWVQYGAALDAAGDWNAARSALERAVAMAPDEPVALNYLGYGLLTHGGDKRAAAAMLAKAARLSPEDPAIADSLGWALLLNGDAAQALPLIERAAAGDPANAEIGEHLGDAYWRAGRRYEARYAWRAASVVADAAAAKRLDGKIADGL